MEIILPDAILYRVANHLLKQGWETEVQMAAQTVRDKRLSVKLEVGTDKILTLFTVMHKNTVVYQGRDPNAAADIYDSL